MHSVLHFNADAAGSGRGCGRHCHRFGEHPLTHRIFPRFLQAQASKAEVIGLAMPGDTVNAIKQASEFGIVKGGQKLAALLMFITDVHALGLNAAHGFDLTTTFYWDLTRHPEPFSKRFQERMANKAMPTMVAGGRYSRLISLFIKTLDKLGENPHDGAKVVAAMKAMPVDDPLFGKGRSSRTAATSTKPICLKCTSGGNQGAMGLLQLIPPRPATKLSRRSRETCSLLKK